MTDFRILNKPLELKLQRDGYAVLPSFISAEQINLLQQFFHQTLAQSGVDVPFFTTHWSSSKAYRQTINNYVQQLLTPNLNLNFENYKCLLGYYLYKKPSAASSVSMHKDWTLIDEENYSGYTFWIPLIQITEANGCFQVVPGSHLNKTTPRGTNLPQQYPEVKEADFKSVPAEAGDAIIFDHRLLHSSPPNLSSADRLVAGLAIVPQNAVPLHYYYNPATKETTCYKVEDTFLVDTFFDYKKTQPDDYILDIIHSRQEKSL